jgi:hypothetical protein
MAAYQLTEAPPAQLWIGAVNDLVVAIPSAAERPSVVVPAGNPAAGGLIKIADCEDTEAGTLGPG